MNFGDFLVHKFRYYVALSDILILRRNTYRPPGTLCGWIPCIAKAEYAYVPYSSLEAVIEQSKDRYYLALRRTQSTLKTGAPDWLPWLVFLLKAMRQQKARLQIKLDRGKILLAKLPTLSLQILELTKSRGRLTISEIVTLTQANRNTVKKHLERLVADRHMQAHGEGRGAWYSF